MLNAVKQRLGALQPHHHHHHRYYHLDAMKWKIFIVCVLYVDFFTNLRHNMVITSTVLCHLYRSLLLLLFIWPKAWDMLRITSRDVEYLVWNLAKKLHGSIISNIFITVFWKSNVDLCAMYVVSSLLKWPIFTREIRTKVVWFVDGPSRGSFWTYCVLIMYFLSSY